MAEPPLPPRPADTDPPPDPFEADLVAYLDGELDVEAARRVEARLAVDPQARARAAALQKTFDLLDCLPRPEPSPDFVRRTLERIVRVGADEPAGAADRAQGSDILPPVAVPSSHLPCPASDPAADTTAAGRFQWAWAAALVVACATCAAGAYLAVAELRRQFLEDRPSSVVADEPSPTDPRVITLLPLYAGADDLDFVRELARPELFGDHPAVAPDSDLRPPPIEPTTRPSPARVEPLTAAFQSLPPARRQAIRELDRQLHALDDATRDRLIRVLEVYAAWLDRLDPVQRRAVFDAPTAAQRLEVIRQLRAEQWLQSLPQPLRAELTLLTPQQKAERVRSWREEETARREEWSQARRHAADIAADRAPWPFDIPARRQEVLDFVRSAFRLDDPRRCRLTPFELHRYRAALDQAEKLGGWWWYGYGRVVYELTRKYEPYLVSEPAGGPVPILPRSGPARLAELPEPLRSFVREELLPRLPPAGRQELAAAEGRWPDYLRVVVRLCRQHDLSAPGLMLPGSPRRWEATYGRPFFGFKP